ncbi:MAG: hypothetical protein U0I22_08935 [Treponema sp.]|nr:hypothetical protein [Treponema sp.]
MNGNYFTKQIDSSRRPLNSKQRAALLFSLLGRDGFESLTPYLTDQEIVKLRKAMKSIKDRIDVEDDVSVLESLQKYGEAINAWPQKSLPNQGYTKGYFESYSQYQEPEASGDKGLEGMGVNAADIARVLSMWLSDDKEA